MTADSGAITDDIPEAVPGWRERLSDPSLTALLVLNAAVIFLVSPLAAMGHHLPEFVAFLLLVAQIAIVLLLTPSRRTAPRRRPVARLIDRGGPSRPVRDLDPHS